MRQRDKSLMALMNSLPLLCYKLIIVWTKNHDFCAVLMTFVPASEIHHLLHKHSLPFTLSFVFAIIPQCLHITFAIPAQRFMCCTTLYVAIQCWLIMLKDLLAMHNITIHIRGC